MNARDYIYDALSESMYAVKDNVKALSNYIDMDFDYYFGSSNSQIVKDENGIEVLSEVPDEYVEGKVVCTAEEGREMFDEIRDEALKELLEDLLDYYDGLYELDETEIVNVEFDDYGNRLDDYKTKDIKFLWLGEIDDTGSRFVEDWMENLEHWLNNHMRLTDYEIASLIGATHYFSDENTRFNECNNCNEYCYHTVAYFREYDGGEKPSPNKTITCEVQQVVGEMDIDPFDIIILKGDDDAIDRTGEKYNFHFYDPKFLKECVTDFTRLLYEDLYDEELGYCHGTCFDPYIFVNYDLGLVINSYEEHLKEIDPYDYEHEQLLELIDFALQDEYSKLADMVTGENFVKELSEKINDGKKIIKLNEDDFEIAKDSTSYNSIPIIRSYNDSDFGEMTSVVDYITPKNKKLKLRYSQTWQNNGASEEDGISMELYNYAVNNLNMSNADIPSFLSCTHIYETESGDIYGFIEQK